MDANASVLSIIAQSAATIVAVVAGFITAVILNLSSKRESVKDEIENERAAIQRLDDDREENTAEAFSKRIIVELEEKTEAIWYMVSPEDPQWARTNLRMSRYSEDRFATVWDQYYRHFQDEREWLESHIAQESLDIEEYRLDFNEWAEGVLINPTGHDEALLSKMFHLAYIQWARANDRDSIPFNHGAIAVTLDFSEAETLEEAARLLGQQSAMGQVRLGLLNDQKRLLSKSPAHLALGYWLMIGLTVAGVCVPMFLMVDDWCDRRIWTAFSLFGAGIVSLFAFMAKLIFPEWMKRSHRRG